MSAPRVAVLVITDGRTDYLRRCLASLDEHVSFPFAERIIVDDSGDPTHLEQFELTDWLRVRHAHRRGGAAAIRTAWATVAEFDVDYVFHLEQDFTFTGPVDVGLMLGVLDADPKLANLVLRRGPHGLEGPGGYVGDDRAGHVLHYKANTAYMVHRNGFWLNPCVYSRRVLEYGWPEHGHEHEFSARVLDAGYHFGVLGSHDDDPRCIHLGDRRSPAWTW